MHDKRVEASLKNYNLVSSIRHIMRNIVLIVFLGIARAQECFVSKNCITSSSRINVTRPNDVWKCLADCKNQNGCKWFTYDPDPDWCALMTDCQQPADYQCRACASGEVTCEEYHCGITGLCLVLFTRAFRTRPFRRTRTRTQTEVRNSD
jgi:hypothetical protein